MKRVLYPAVSRDDLRVAREDQRVVVYYHDRNRTCSLVMTLQGVVEFKTRYRVQAQWFNVMLEIALVERQRWLVALADDWVSEETEEE